MNLARKRGVRVSSWPFIVGVLALLVAVGFEGFGASGANMSHLAHRAVLNAVVRALLGAVIVIFVMGLGLLVVAALRHVRPQRSRLRYADRSSFPLWMQLLISFGAILFLVFVGYLFSILAPRRRHQTATIEHLGANPSPRLLPGTSNLAHFDYLIPAGIGLALLALLGIGALLRRQLRRHRSRGRLQSISHEPVLQTASRPLTDIETISDPRERIVACWEYAEARLQENGVYRQVYESPPEFVSRISDTLPLSCLELATLASLFVEARYSDHVISERDGELAFSLATIFSVAAPRLATNV